MNQPSNSQGIAHLRCADEDRELVARLLNNAYADGRLDFEEHDERISKAYNAKTFGELDGLTLDLIPGAPTRAPLPQRPAMSVFQPPVQHAAEVAPRPSSVPMTAPMFTGGKAILSSFRPDKGLVLPSYVELMSVLGDARVDLVDATFTAREIVVKVLVLMGELRIRVPEGVTVVNNVTTVMGEFKSEGAMPRDNGVVLRLEGTVCMGEMRVMGPDVKRPRKYEKFVA